MSSSPLSTPAAGHLPADRYLDLIEAEARRFASVVDVTAPTARSRSYPGYDAATLAAHVGSILVRTGHTVRTGEILTDAARLAPPAGLPVAKWLEESTRTLVDDARRADPSREVATFPFAEVTSLTALYRSTLTEVAIHRWDLESAIGDHVPLAPDLSVDLVDSIFDWWAPALLADRRIGLFLGGTLILEAVDVRVRWSVSVEDGVLIGRRTGSSSNGDAVLSGAADALLLTVWKRIALEAADLAVAGDPDLVARFLRIPYIPDPQITAAH